MKAPQIIMLSVMLVDWCAVAYMHDKPRTGRFDIRVQTMNVLAVLVLLVWGGFFW